MAREGWLSRGEIRAPSIRLISAVGRQIDRHVFTESRCAVKGAAGRVVVTEIHFCVRRGGEGWILGDDLNHTAGGIAAEQSSLGPHQNLDALDVVELK